MNIFLDESWLTANQWPFSNLEAQRLWSMDSLCSSRSQSSQALGLSFCMGTQSTSLHSKSLSQTLLPSSSKGKGFWMNLIWTSNGRFSFSPTSSKRVNRLVVFFGKPRLLILTCLYLKMADINDKNRIIIVIKGFLVKMGPNWLKTSE